MHAEHLLFHTGLVQLERLNLGWCTSVCNDDMKGLQSLTRLSKLQRSRTKVDFIVPVSECSNDEKLLQCSPGAFAKLYYIVQVAILHQDEFCHVLGFNVTVMVIPAVLT